MKLVGNQKSPYVELNFVGKNKEKASDMVLVDTGMDGLYDMSKRAYTIFEKSKIFEALYSATGIGDSGLFGAGNSNEQKLLEIENANLNQQIINNIMVTTTTDDNSRIRLDFIKYGDITLDFLNKKFYFLYFHLNKNDFVIQILKNLYILNPLSSQYSFNIWCAWSDILMFLIFFIKVNS